MNPIKVADIGHALKFPGAPIRIVRDFTDEDIAQFDRNLRPGLIAYRNLERASAGVYEWFDPEQGRSGR